LIGGPTNPSRISPSGIVNLHVHTLVRKIALSAPGVRPDPQYEEIAAIAGHFANPACIKILLLEIANPLRSIFAGSRKRATGSPQPTGDPNASQPPEQSALQSTSN
jgi:hypothetical protein